MMDTVYRRNDEGPQIIVDGKRYYRSNRMVHVGADPYGDDLGDEMYEYRLVLREIVINDKRYVCNRNFMKGRELLKLAGLPKNIRLFQHVRDDFGQISHVRIGAGTSVCLKGTSHFVSEG